MPDSKRAELYALGGTKLIVETLVVATRKLIAAEQNAANEALRKACG